METISNTLFWISNGLLVPVVVPVSYTHLDVYKRQILGTLLCILFLMWFLSAFVMMYHRFPRVSAKRKCKSWICSPKPETHFRTCLLYTSFYL